VYEYTGQPDCIFRTRRIEASQAITLADGTAIRPGDALLELHLWNEQVPPIGRDGPTLAWALDIKRRIRLSLDALADHVRREPDLAAVVAVFADLRLGTAEETGQITRIVARYGFETPPGAGPAGPHALRRLGENILALMLVLATNPRAARFTVLRRARATICLSRARLERYGTGRADLLRHQPRNDREGSARRDGPHR
jgi:hypothetical protein